MEYALVGLLLLFLIYLFVESKRKSERVLQAVAIEKQAIAEDSGMTAMIGVFSPDIQTTVVIGASEELGVFYYRMLRQSKIINKSRINLANLSRIEFLINGKVHEVSLQSAQPTLSLRATEISENMLSSFAPDSIKEMRRATLRISFFDAAGAEKQLEITTLRSNDERQRFERVQLLKTTIWWVAFLQMASRNARHVKTSLEAEKIE